MPLAMDFFASCQKETKNKNVIKTIFKEYNLNGMYIQSCFVFMKYGREYFREFKQLED